MRANTGGHPWILARSGREEAFGGGGACNPGLTLFHLPRSREPVKPRTGVLGRLSRPDRTDRWHTLTQDLRPGLFLAVPAGLEFVGGVLAQSVTPPSFSVRCGPTKRRTCVTQYF